MSVCVIGAGRWGFNHVRTLHKIKQLGGVVEANPDQDAKIKTLDSTIPIFRSVSDAIDQFDAFVVATPAASHFEVAFPLISQGKHVLIEKPITLNSKDAEALVTAANEKQTVLMVGHVLLFHPAIRKMKALIEDGKIGKIQYLYSNRVNLGTIRTEENSLWSFAPHDISIFQYFLNKRPHSVLSTGGVFLQPTIHDTTVTHLYYPDNTIGHIFVSWLHPFKEHRIVVIGSKGMFVFEDSHPDKPLLYYEKGVDWVNGEPIKREGPTENIAYDQTQQPLALELTHFLDCIHQKDQNATISGEKGCDVLRVLESAQDSLNSAKLVSIHPQGTSAKPSPSNYDCHPTAVIDEGVKIGTGTKIWHYSHIQSHSSIGEGCRIGQNVNVGCNVQIGNYVKIQNNVSVYEGVTLEDYVFCGPSMVFTNINMPRSKYPQADSRFYQKTWVREGASLGANSTVVCGTTLGKHCFVGAGAVVTKDVPDYAVVVGNPARQVGWMSEAGTKLDFSKNNRAFCEKSQKWYELKNNQVSESQVETVKS